MSISPTLRCICDKKFCKRIATYNTSPSGEVLFDLGNEPYLREYFSCDICSHMFGKHNLDLSSLYGGNYVDATYGGREGMVERLKKVLNLPDEHSDNISRVRRIVEFWKSFIAAHEPDSPTALLDVGAGIGVFPAVMKDLGWTASAIEPDARTASHLREEIGISAFNQDFLKLSPKELGVFSLVTFNKVLEHLEDPISLLSHAKHFLSKNGICYVEVPDIRSSEESFLREEFFIEHHHVFSISSCAAMAERSGFRVLKIERIIERSGKYTIFAFLSPDENQD
jgi:SAM-dependent methyltransferase